MIPLQVTTDLLEKTYAVAYIGGAITFLFNAILLVFVKRSIDTSLETHKIAYSGVFKEKIEVHRKLLEHIYLLKLKVQRFGYSGDGEMAQELFKDFESFINFYLINQPFLRPKTLDLLKKLNSEYQEVFDVFRLSTVLRNYPVLDSAKISENALKTIEAMNKFKGNFFQEIEDQIISDMREDLNTK